MCATPVAVAERLLGVPQLMRVSESVLQRVQHECVPNFCRNHCLVNRTQTICDPNAAAVATANDGGADGDGDPNERLA